MKDAVRTSTVVVALCGMMLLTASPAWGEAGDHNGGFFLRLSGGGGFASTSITEPTPAELEFSGPAGELNLAVGAVVTPNLAIHGTMWGWLVSSPSAKIDGTDAGELNSNLDLAAFGGGATYYFMPANVYLSGSAGVGKLSTEGGNTDAGFVMDLSLGKEWWVSSKWGLGLAAGFQYHNIPDGGISENWSGTSFALRFSATLN